MEVRELRIGNKVKCKTSNDARIYDVLALDGLHLKIYLNSPRNVWHIEDLIKPIKLTEELLLKCGFKLITDDGGVCGDYTYWSNGEIELNNLGYWFVVSTDFHHPKIKYIHQLQNLYYYLTGEELEVNF